MPLLEHEAEMHSELEQLQMSAQASYTCILDIIKNNVTLFEGEILDCTTFSVRTQKMNRESFENKMKLKLDEKDSEYIDLAPFYLRAWTELDKVFRTDFKKSPQYRELVQKLPENLIEYEFATQAGLIN